MIGGSRHLSHLNAEIGAAHKRPTVGNLDVRSGHLQHLTGHRLQALHQCRRRKLAGTAGNHQRAACESAPAV
jgi:hypothetical protein